MAKSGVERFKDRYREVYLDLEARVNEDYDKKRAEFKEFYSARQNDLKAAENSFRNLTHLLLSDALYYIPKVVLRLKDRDECLKKFEIKYRNDAEKSESDYKISDYITDMIAVRVICLYESDI